MDNDEHNIVSPVFNGVTIDATDRSYDNGESGDAQVRFLGTYKNSTFDATDNSILLMGAENTLYYPTNGASLGAQRAYIKLGADASQARKLTSFNIDSEQATKVERFMNYCVHYYLRARGRYAQE